MFVFRLCLVSFLSLFLFFGIASDVSVHMNGLEYSFSKFELIVECLLISAVLELFLTLRKSFVEHILKPRPIKYIKFFIESIIMKDHSMAKKYIKKLEKVFGNNNELLTWVNGYVNYYSGDLHKAKANFYKLVEKNDDILGGYSLFQVAQASGDRKTAFEALLSLKSSGVHMPKYLIEELGRLEILRGEFDSAIDNFKSIKNNRLIAIAHFLKDGKTEKSLEKAYYTCDEIPEIAIRYAKTLALDKSYGKKAQNILLATWKKVQVPEIFRAFIELGGSLNDAKIFVCDSFVSYNEIGKLAMAEDMVGIAYEFLMKAYNLYPASETYRNIQTVCEKDRQFKPLEAGPLRESPHWICSTCQIVPQNWSAICNCCRSIDSCKWTFGQEEVKPNFPLIG